ncbi:MAG: efflux RND transporter permease subunit [Pirellulaceae bacterium]
MKHSEEAPPQLQPPTSWIDRWMDSRWILLAIAMIAAAIAYPAQRQWRMEHDLEAMFRGDSPLLRDFQSLKTRFGGNEAVLGIFEAPQLWESPSPGNPDQKNPDQKNPVQKNPVQKTPAPLQQLDAIAQRWRAIDGVQAVVDLAMLDQWIGRLEKPQAKSSATPADSPALLGQSLTSDSKLAQAVLGLFDGYTHRRGSPIVAVVALLDPKRQTSTSQLLAQMKSDAALPQPTDGSAAPLSFVGLVGEPVLVEEGFDLIERDGQRLTWSVTFLVGLVLGFLFRSIRWTVTACLVILWSMLVTRGLLAGLGFQLSMVSSMLGAIVSIVATATITHWIVDAQQTRRSGVSAKQALRQSLGRLWKPMLLAGLTDIVGFGSLAFSTVAPVRDYGLMMGVACAVVVAGIFLIAPALAPGGWQWPLPDRRKEKRTDEAEIGSGILQRWLMAVADWSGRWRYLLAALGALVLVVSTVGLRWLESETDFLRNFDPDLPMVQAFQRVDRDLGGAGLWDIQLPLPDAIDAKWVDQVSGFQQRLTAIRIDGLDQPAIGKVLSLIDLDRLLKDSGALGAVTAWLPVQARWEAARALFPELIGSLWSKREPKGDQPGWLRIQLRSPEGLSARQRRALIDAVEGELERTTELPEWRRPFGKESSKGSATGHYVLVQHLVESLLQDQWKCFGSAVLGIILVLWWSTGRLSWALVSMALHALPAIVLVGTYAWLGWKTDLGAALIASVSLGLSIDSAIHYLMAWRRHRDGGASERESIERCQMAVGPASIAATAALVIGFSSLLTSDFRPTASFGQMASITMGLGLLANLIGMPALLSTRRQAD